MVRQIRREGQMDISPRPPRPCPAQLGVADGIGPSALPLLGLQADREPLKQV